MIEGTRSMLQASIDERSEVIARIIEEVPRLIHKQFGEYEQEAKTLASDGSDGDKDIYLNIYNSTLGAHNPDDEYWMIEEINRSLVLLIVSFAETTVKHLLKDPNQKFKGGNYLCKAYNQVNKELSLNLKKIGQYWKGRQGFIKVRNDIAHGRSEVPVDKNFLITGLSGVHKLLRTIADAIDMKEQQKRKNTENTL